MPKARGKRAKPGSKRLRERPTAPVSDETDSNTRDFEQVKHRFSISSLILGFGPLVPKRNDGTRHSSESIKRLEIRPPSNRDNRPEVKADQRDDSSRKTCGGAGSHGANSDAKGTVSRYHDETNDCQTEDVAKSEPDNDDSNTTSAEQHSTTVSVDSQLKSGTEAGHAGSFVMSFDSKNEEVKTVQADDLQSSYTYKSGAAAQADLQRKHACSEDADAPKNVSSGPRIRNGAAGTDVEKRGTFAEEARDPSKLPASADAGQNGATSPLQPSMTDMGEWSFSDDAFIRSMKEQGASWNLIAGSIGRTKNQVRKRFFELKAAEANAIDAAASQSELAETRAREPSSEDSEEEDDCSEADAEQDVAVEGDGEKAPSFVSEDHSSTSSATEEDDYDASDYDPFADPSDPVAHRRERRRSGRYLRRHIHAQLYPPGLANSDIQDELHGTGAGDTFYPRMLEGGIGKQRMTMQEEEREEEEEDERRNGAQSNPFFNQGLSRRDRKLLAELRDRRAATQWLEMQANFFNVTGRMIPLQLIKAKMEGQSPVERDVGPFAREQRRVADWTKGVAPGEDLLDPAKARDAPEDAIYNVDEDE